MPDSGTRGVKQHMGVPTEYSGDTSKRILVSKTEHGLRNHWKVEVLGYNASFFGKTG
jgi:hypothetical protein